MPPVNCELTPGLIHDWNCESSGPPRPASRIELLDETLRDGLQSPSVIDPDVGDKLALLHLMAGLGVQVADIGLPGAGPRAMAHCLALAREITRARLPIRPICAARTTVHDIRPIVDISQKTGLAINVYAFIGCSPLRLYAEDWSVDTLVRHIDTACRFAVGAGLPVCLVIEDATRAPPGVLAPLVRHAIALGARRLCLCDTVGHATPAGVERLFAWTREILAEHDRDIKLDWHGHNDRGLAVANSLQALMCGADRVHGTALGLGERVGNAAIDQVLVNLKLMDLWPQDLGRLVSYCEAVAAACQVTIPHNYPLVGRDAFRTGTGVHAAAIIKAQRKNDMYLADRVYSAVPASLFGRHQEIEVGPLSGQSNVVYWLESRGIVADADLVAAVYAAAKNAGQLLAETELRALVRDHHARLSHAHRTIPEATGTPRTHR